MTGYVYPSLEQVTTREAITIRKYTLIRKNFKREKIACRCVSGRQYGKIENTSAPWPDYLGLKLDLVAYCI